MSAGVIISHGSDVLKHELRCECGAAYDALNGTFLDEPTVRLRANVSFGSGDISPN